MAESPSTKPKTTIPTEPGTYWFRWPFRGPAWGDPPPRWKTALLKHNSATGSMDVYLEQNERDAELTCFQLSSIVHGPPGWAFVGPLPKMASLPMFKDPREGAWPDDSICKHCCRPREEVEAHSKCEFAGPILPPPTSKEEDSI